MTTLREHLRAIVYGEQLAHEDELIDLYQQHAAAALAILDQAAPQCLNNPPHCSHRLVPDPPAAS